MPIGRLVLDLDDTANLPGSESGLHANLNSGPANHTNIMTLLSPKVKQHQSNIPR